MITYTKACGEQVIDAERSYDSINIKVFKFDDLYIGMSESITRTITKADLLNFSLVSGDNNPVHIDEAFAKNTIFNGCVVHGMLSASLISAVIGTKLPGPGCIYLNQTIRFLAPVRPGETVQAVCKVHELFPKKRHIIFDTKCYVNNTIVIDGSALVKFNN